MIVMTLRDNMDIISDEQNNKLVKIQYLEELVIHVVD